MVFKEIGGIFDFKLVDGVLALPSILSCIRLFFLIEVYGGDNGW